MNWQIFLQNMQVTEASVEEHTPNNQPRKYNLASYSATLLHVIGTLVCSEEDSLK